jgi:hypothetical protein
MEDEEGLTLELTRGTRNIATRKYYDQSRAIRRLLQRLAGQQ